MLFGQTDSAHFLAAVQRIKRMQERRRRLTRLAVQRVKQSLRKLRPE